MQDQSHPRLCIIYCCHLQTALKTTNLNRLSHYNGNSEGTLRFERDGVLFFPAV